MSAQVNLESESRHEEVEDVVVVDVDDKKFFQLCVSSVSANGVVSATVTRQVWADPRSTHHAPMRSQRPDNAQVEEQTGSSRC